LLQTYIKQHLPSLFFVVPLCVVWCARVIWFRVFICSEKPNYASTPEHTNGAA